MGTRGAPDNCPMGLTAFKFLNGYGPGRQEPAYGRTWRLPPSIFVCVGNPGSL
jgi:hypothetical protein